MKLLDGYFELQKQIYDYFGYKEDWVVIPLEDCREYYWTLDGEKQGNKVWFCDNKNVIIKLIKNEFDYGDENIYSYEIYTQHFLPKWVYRGKDFTMICVDTQTDGNKFLSIYSNEKEIKHD